MSIWKVEGWVENSNPYFEEHYETQGFFFSEEEAIENASPMGIVSPASKQEVELEIRCLIFEIERLQNQVERLRSFLEE